MVRGGYSETTGGKPRGNPNTSQDDLECEELDETTLFSAETVLDTAETPSYHDTGRRKYKHTTTGRGRNARAGRAGEHTAPAQIPPQIPPAERKEDGAADKTSRLAWLTSKRKLTATDMTWEEDKLHNKYA